MSSVEKSRVLLVDDNEATTTLVMALLRRDFLVDSVDDGAAAIERLRTNKYAVIVLDLLMTNVGGFEVLDFLRENDPGMLPHVLVVTAAVGRDYVERAQSYNVCAVIAKPFDVDVLLATARDCANATPSGKMGRFISRGVILLFADLLRQRLM